MFFLHWEMNVKYLVLQAKHSEEITPEDDAISE